MAEEEAAEAPRLRLVNFISEEQIDQAKRTRGERADDGTAQRDKPLYEILKENKDRKDAEFNERFKHRPPKALDEDETEFLDNLESSRREYEQQLANEEEEQLRIFQEAVAARASIVRELKDTPTVPTAEEKKPAAKRSQPAGPRNIFISVKPQEKKAKTVPESEKSTQVPQKPFLPSNKSTQVPQKPFLPSNGLVNDKPPNDDDDGSTKVDDDDGSTKVGALGALASYGSEGEEDE
uniref:FAM192A/Fyv6 N-terminal domain-containing protein n=1 Tax=Ananas comosus var. bracteatus TaxID=296719 RepID=A0A6V7PFM9_ANACO|nr:unnamed protein product [Ananas comosus var. bracteatus]